LAGLSSILPIFPSFLPLLKVSAASFLHDPSVFVLLFLKKSIIFLIL